MSAKKWGRSEGKDEAKDTGDESALGGDGDHIASRKEPQEVDQYQQDTEGGKGGGGGFSPALPMEQDQECGDYGQGKGGGVVVPRTGKVQGDKTPQRAGHAASGAGDTEQVLNGAGKPQNEA